MASHETLRLECDSFCVGFAKQVEVEQRKCSFHAAKRIHAVFSCFGPIRRHFALKQHLSRYPLAQASSRALFDVA
ncbi:hypothetical protein GQ57_34550 [Burkholderia sp. MSh2]|nr:hypothetical protein GQ57_34550 [Burkholderia sp. MSh2]KFG97689.1 hypothetical protein GQ56_0109190 [Burkholderia paludis]